MAITMSIRDVNSTTNAARMNGSKSRRRSAAASGHCASSASLRRYANVIRPLLPRGTNVETRRCAMVHGEWRFPRKLRALWYSREATCTVLFARLIRSQRRLLITAHLYVLSPKMSGTKHDGAYHKPTTTTSCTQRERCA